MAYIVAKTKEESLQQLQVLIEAFHREYAVYKTLKYSEAQLRIDFINPLLKTFGWDVDNEQTKTQFLREVIQEESIDVEEEDAVGKKNPDYTLRILGIRKLFVEAKKVCIDLDKTNKPAFQIRRYGWNANLGISILTNFETIAVYDCRYKPNVDDAAIISRYQTFHLSEFINRFDELYQIFSFQSVASGFIDEYFSIAHKEVTTFDNYFLKQIESWRQCLANDLIVNNVGFNNEDINFLIQRLLNRIVFLRICEDREIEKYETLKNIKSYNELKCLFISSDKKYNSGLFDFIEDNFSLNINFNSEILISIFNELYYPESPYDFSVVDPTILSQIYERYLGSKISIVNEREIIIVEEPEVAASNGVVPTPKLIVQNIVKETLGPLFDGKSLQQIQQLKIADICCGSGTFLISVYDYFYENITLNLASENSNSDIIYKSFNGSYHLTLKAKHEILTSNIFGVDINAYAVEVTKFSLLLKLLENENANSIDHFLAKYDQKVLPNLDGNIKCGNSLVDDSYFKFKPESIDNNELLFKLKPFNWNQEFSFLQEINGFDAIVGNPPYVRIQNIVKFSLEEIEFFQSELSGYTVAKVDTFDKYYLFIQRAINLLNDKGYLGYIVPHKFFIVKGGKALRAFITSQSLLFKIIHFGVTQVFPNRSTYTAILILDKKGRKEFFFKRIHRIASELTASSIKYDTYNTALFSEQPWVFVSKKSENVFEKLKRGNTIALCSIAEIAVGLQTSADRIFIFQPNSETETTYRLKFKDIEYEVEKAICKPCLYDLSFGLFDTIKPNAQLIFPYIIQNGKAEIYSEDHFQQNYPLTWSYLNNFKDVLSKRSINGGKELKWYQYGRSQSLTRFHNTPKLIWTVLSTKPSYVFDENNLQFTGGGNGPYYSLFTNSDYSLHFILGILAHPIFEAMVKAGASEFRGSYFSHGKQFIEKLPIRKIDFKNAIEKRLYNEVVRTVKKLIETKAIYENYLSVKKKILQRKMNFLFDSLIEQVNSLYGISEIEMNAVLSDDMLNDKIFENE